VRDALENIKIVMNEKAEELLAEGVVEVRKDG
jgi:hypothetical protein